MSTPSTVPQARTFSKSVELKELKTPQEIRQYLEGFAVFTLRDCALYLGVDHAFYRRTILTLPTHPTPIDITAKNVSWWGGEMVSWLSDPSKIKRKV